MDDLIFATAKEMAAAILERRVSSAELLDAHLAQIARCNLSVNAIVTIDEAGARHQAHTLDLALARGEVTGPLHGVPVGLDDSFATAGMRTTVGYRPLADHVPTVDASIAKRLRAAGAIIIGKTNLPARAMDIQTHNDIFGRTNNPWNLDRTPGGHTGGGAAAVAAGMVACSVGSDVGGSIRIPAHYCGLYALRPTEHRIPRTGQILLMPGEPKAWRRFNVVGPLARSVEDMELLLTVLAGPDGEDWEVPPVPLRTAFDRLPASLRVAWVDRFPGTPITADTRSAIAELVEGLASLGHLVEPLPLDAFAFDMSVAAFWPLAMAEVSGWRPEHRPYEVAEVTMYEHAAMLERRDRFIDELERCLSRWDALICPVSPQPAFAHCPPGAPIPVDDQEVPYAEAEAAYCAPFSLTGHPSIVLPVSHSTEGLPIGVQVVGRRWEDMRLLALAARLTEATHDFQPPPGY